MLKHYLPMKYIFQQQVWRLCLSTGIVVRQVNIFLSRFSSSLSKTEITSEGEAIPRLYDHLWSLEKIMETVVWSAPC